MAALTMVIAVGGCDVGPDQRTRSGEAVLSVIQLADTRSNDDERKAVPLKKTTQACGQVSEMLGQLKMLGSGLVSLPGGGVMEIDSGIWSRITGQQRQSIMRVLALENRCLSDTAQGTAIIRDIETARVLSRFTEA